MPDDVEVLEKALAHEDGDALLRVLDRLGTLVAREMPRRTRALAARLRALEELHRDERVQAAAARVRALLR